MKRQSLFPFIVIGFLLTCQNQSGSDERPFAGREEDLAAPIAGGNIYFTNVTDNSITVNWPAAKDNLTHPNQLRYRLVKAFTATEIDSISKVDGVTGFDLLVDYQENVTSYTVTGLSPNTTYYFAVVVKDEAQNKALYQPAAQATSGPATFNVVSATSTSNTTVDVVFSHAPTQGNGATGAENTNNYKIVGGSNDCSDASVLGVSGASLSGSTVTLTTASQSAISYKVCVSGVTRDSDSVALTTNYATFTGTGASSLIYALYSFTAGDPLSSAGITIRCTSQLDNTLASPGTVGGSYSGGTNVGGTSFGVLGLGAHGISVLNTSVANSNCQYDGTNNGYIYSIDIPINTTGKSGILVSYNVAQYSNETREWGVRLQYSTDGGSTFSDVSNDRWDYDSAKAGSVIYTAPNGYSKYGPFLLPAAANNNANVVLRWRYFNTSGTSGNRTRIVLDDIVVDSGGTSDSTAPSAVTLSGTGSGLTMPLSWTASSDVVTPTDNIIYEVHRSTTGSFTPSVGTLLYVTLPGKLAYTDTGLVDGTTYYYKVRAVDSAGNTSTSNEISYTAVSPFNVSLATSTSNTTVDVVFSHAPTPGDGGTGAENTANYKIVNGSDPCTASDVLAVTAASLSGSTVTLTTASQSATSYKVCVDNVTRNSDSVALTTNSATFTGTGAGPSYLLQENFNYGSTGGNLTTLSGGNWTAHSSGGINPIQYNTTPLTMTGYCGGGGVGAATFGAVSGEDVNRTYTAQTSGTMYYAALVNLSSIGNTTGDYFLHIGNGTSNFYARLYARNNGSGQVNFGVARATETPTWAPGTYSIGTTYLIVVKSDAFGTTGGAYLFILTAPSGTEPGTPDATATGNTTNIASYDRVYIRQGTAANMPSGKIGCITVGKTWSSLFE